MEKIYEIRDASDDEGVYYTCGYFSTFEKAKEQITPENIDSLKSEFTDQYRLDMITFEIHEQPLDKINDGHNCIFKGSFEKKYNEEKDEYFYEQITQELNNQPKE